MIFKYDDLIDCDKYDESDLDCTRGNRKHSYYSDTKHYFFPYLDLQGNEQELITHVECFYRVTHGTFDPKEDSDWDFRGYTDLMSWDVFLVENNEGSEVDPKDVLTPEQFLDYNEGLDEFIGD